MDAPWPLPSTVDRLEGAVHRSSFLAVLTPTLPRTLEQPATSVGRRTRCIALEPGRAPRRDRGAAARARGEVDMATEPVESRPAVEPVNEVRLRGRWTGAKERQLPSGDEVVVARVVVPRSGGGVDTLECAVWTRALRRRAMRLDDDVLVEVTGCLRRRFWRTPGGPASRYEVEIGSIRRLPPTGSRRR